MESKALDRAKFVRDWFDEWAAEPPVYGWATKLLDDRIDNVPEVAWELVLDLIDKAPGDEALGWVAAGPLEDLLGGWGPDFIERVEALARSNDRFRRCLAGVWSNRMAPDVYSRIRRLVDEA
jgi:hypothetical protein